MIKCIHVGLGNFSLQRLQVNLSNNIFDPVAFVDIDIESSIKRMKNLKNLPKNYEKKIFKSIDEAVDKNPDVEASFIFVSSEIHPRLIIKSLEYELDVLCVKSIACNIEDFKRILDLKKKKNKILVQGLNNQWNECSLKMQELLKDKNNFGELLAGNCLMWGRQNLSNNPPVLDVMQDGIFFHSMGCHQLSQILDPLGLPEKVYSSSTISKDEKIGFKGIPRTGNGSAMLKYKNGSSINYIGTRAGHGNPYGYASRWSGKWIFHGTNGDIIRDGGRLTLFQNGNMVQDHYLKDLDNMLIEDEKKQFEEFYQLIKNKTKSKIEINSLNSWLLMEALNISSRKNEIINIEELLKKTGLDELQR